MDAMDTSSAHDADLKAYLDAVARDGAYERVRALGAHGEDGRADRDEAGSTELVRFAGRDGAWLGPFVRKRIDLAMGLGTAYEAIYQAQRAGRRFSHLPRIIECYKTGAELVVVSEYVPGASLDAYARRWFAAGDTMRATGDAPAGDGASGASADEAAAEAERPGGAVPAAAASRKDRGVALAARVFPQLCEAVAELHEAFDPPIIHRDLKPQNVIVAPEGLFLIDFGIARRYRDDAVRDTVRFGTRRYAPPEQYGFGQTDVRSDIYALGMLLAFCLTGAEPTGPLDAAALAAVAGEPLAQVAVRAAAFDPAARYPDVRALEAAFQSALAATGADADELGEGGPDATLGEAGAHAERDPRQPDGRAAAGAASPAGVGSAPTDAAPPAATLTSAAVAGFPASPDSAARAGAPSPERLRKRPRPSQPLPGWAAVVWDLMLGVVAAACVQVAMQGIVQPAPESAMQPLWYRIIFNIGFMLPLCLGALYLAADKRWLKRRFAAFAHRTLRADARVYGFYLLVAFMAVLVASAIMG